MAATAASPMPPSTYRRRWPPPPVSVPDGAAGVGDAVADPAPAGAALVALVALLVPAAFVAVRCTVLVDDSVAAGTIDVAPPFGAVLVGCAPGVAFAPTVPVGAAIGPTVGPAASPPQVPPVPSWVWKRSGSVPL